MKVVCKNTERQEFLVELESTQNLGHLFQKLQETYGVDPEKSTLIFNGQVLHDLSKTLEDLKYMENDWFVLFNRKLKGPGPLARPRSPARNVSRPKNANINSNINSNANANSDSNSRSNSNTNSNASTGLSDTVAAPSTPIAGVAAARVEAKENIKSSVNRLPPNTRTVKISEEAVESLLEILINDPNCSRLIQENPSLGLRIRDPNVLVNLANMVGLDLSRFVRSTNVSENPEESEPKISDTIWPSRSYNVPLMPVPPRPEVLSEGESSSSHRQVLRISAAEARVLTKIKTDLMDIIGELPENINEYQINTVIYECYIAADKNPEAALNILIDHMLDQGDRSDLGLSSPIRPIRESTTESNEETLEEDSQSEDSEESEESSDSLTDNQEKDDEVSADSDEYNKEEEES